VKDSPHRLQRLPFAELKARFRLASRALRRSSATTFTRMRRSFPPRITVSTALRSMPDHVAQVAVGRIERPQSRERGVTARGAASSWAGTAGKAARAGNFPAYNTARSEEVR